MASDEKIPEEPHDVNGRRGHVLMFPFMAQGHLIPFVALAKLLEARTSFIITLVNTTLNIRNLRSLLPPKTTIRLAELPFSSVDHDLPPQAENTDTMAYPLIVRFFQASETLQPSFDHLVFNISTEDGHPPLCIIADTFLGWTANVANKYGIFHTAFNTCGAYGMAVYTSLWFHLPHSRTELDEFELPDFPGVWINRSQLSNHLKSADGKDTWSVIFRKQLSSCFDNSGGMLSNTVEEMEKKGVQQLRRMMMGRPVWTVGPLLPLSLFDSPSTIEARAGKEPGIAPENCVDWLNLHPPGSVLYISFGSQNTISAAQMMQLAIGLEASGKKFIWVVRPPLGMPLMGEFRAEWLPEGFEDRLISKKQGIVVRSWAPQLEILSHRSTAAFLSHCGWNSVLESLSQGVPIIGWPLAGEQFYNSKLLEEELGVCVELVRGNSSEIGCDRVERVVRLVMERSEKGEEMKTRASYFRETMREAIREDGSWKGSSVQAFDHFIQTVVAEVGRRALTDAEAAADKPDDYFAQTVLDKHSVQHDLNHQIQPDQRSTVPNKTKIINS